MIVRELIYYLKEEIRDLKRYQAIELSNRLDHIEQVVSAGRELGYISDTELKELMGLGYVSSSKQYFDGLIEARGGIDYLMRQTDPVPGHPHRRILKKDSELEKMFGEMGELISIMLGVKEDKFPID